MYFKRVFVFETMTFDMVFSYVFFVAFAKAIFFLFLFLIFRRNTNNHLEKTSVEFEQETWFTQKKIIQTFKV